MKVFHLHFGKDGGAEKFFVHLVRALAHQGVEQTAVIRRSRAWRPQIEPYARIIESNFRNLSLDRLTLPIRIRNLAERERPDAIMSWVMRAGRLTPRYRHGLTVSRLGDYPSHLDYFKTTEMLVCNTPDIADHVRRIGWTRGVEVISNFTQTDLVPSVPRKTVDTPDNAPVVMTMGRFVKRKGFDTLIEAVAKLPGVFLWIAGDGAERAALETLVRERDMEGRTRFLGWQADTRPFVAAADVFVMPSTHEPLGNVILEAWAQKRPVVTSRAEGPSWFVKEGENGLFADIGNADQFAGAISRILSDPVLAGALSEGGHATLMRQFSEEATAAAYIDLFRRRP
ncbi:lipopolysaccharide biosynthesis protein [Rhizobium sp. Leaf384]|uniref:glycosyltransferase n=1 Tax=unclassified Rhizobium TaxID=2613769 RepID=UPI0007150E5D|nr:MULTISPECIES: glycosyltransferase [unclassified Rhizobium]KQS76864.1 lipopolysaccharide biosynthesis protein [Rhizobium sp. Leaf384]KQS78135.1 lipopolysaccharide biosynthesis protein [Rhizobium sp. Leaf383]